MGPVFLLNEREDSVYDLGIFDRLCKMALSSASADKLDARICAQASQPATVCASGANPRGAVVIRDPKAGARHLSPVICGVKNNDLAAFDEGERSRGLAPSDAARKTLDTTGPHILAGMLTTSVGFCAACVLLLPLFHSFGLLTGAAVTFVYFSSVLALPGLLVWIHTRKS